MQHGRLEAREIRRRENARARARPRRAGTRSACAWTAPRPSGLAGSGSRHFPRISRLPLTNPRGRAQPFSPAKVNGARAFAAASPVAATGRPWSDAREAAVAAESSPEEPFARPSRLSIAASGVADRRGGAGARGRRRRRRARPSTRRAPRSPTSKPQLKADNLADADLVRLRDEGDPLAAELQAVITELAPRLEASAKRLAELTPKSKDATLERFGERGAGRRKAEARRARRRRALGARDAAADRRRQRAHRRGAARPVRARNLRALVEPRQPAAVERGGARSSRRRRRASGRCSAIGCTAWRRGSPRAQAFGLLAVVLAIAALWAPLQWIARRVIARDPAAVAPSRLRRALAAAWTILALAVLPLLALQALAYALDLFDISDPRLQGALDALLDGASADRRRATPGPRIAGAGARELAPVRLSATASARCCFISGCRWRRSWRPNGCWSRPPTPSPRSISRWPARAVGAALVAILMARTLRLVTAPALAGSPGAPPREPWAPARILAVGARRAHPRRDARRLHRLRHLPRQSDDVRRHARRPRSISSTPSCRRAPRSCCARAPRSAAA